MGYYKELRALLPKGNVVPDNPLKFKEIVDLDKVTHVIVGQDPYPYTDRNNKPYASGILFGTDSAETPVSLRHFKRVMEEAYKGESLAHMGKYINDDLKIYSYKDLTIRFLKMLERKNPIKILTFGTHAGALSRHFNNVYKVMHPAALSYDKNAYIDVNVVAEFLK